MAAKLGFEVVKQAMLRLLMKKGDDGIVLTLPKNEIVDYNAKITMDRLIRNGIDPESLTSPDQVLNVLDNINNQAINNARVIPGSSAEGKAITDKLFGKKGEVVDMTGKKMDTSQGIMGGKSVKELMESGQVQKGTDDIKISEKITDRDMFKNADQRLKGPIKRKMDMGEFGKVDVETDYSASINRKEFFDPKAKNMYDKTVKTGPEFFKAQKEQILNTINRKKKEMVPPTHSNYKLLKKSLNDQEDALEAIKVTEDLGGNENMFDFLRTQNIADYKAKPLQRSNYTKTDAEIKAEIEAGNKKGIESLKNKKDDPEGFYTGGMVDVEPNLSDIGHGSDALMARTRLVSPDGQATTSTGLNYLLAEDNDNIRVPFAGGGMGRRAFLKLLASIGGGVAAAKSGILGLGKGAGKQVTKEVAKEVATGSGTVPPYFLNLVSKIKNLGDETLATKDKAIAKKYKDYTMEEDFAGNIEIIKKGDDVAEDVFMSYKVDDVPVKGKKGSTKVEEYEEFTARPDQDGKMKDIEQGVPDEVVQEGSMFEDNLSDFGKADGGRIGYGIGGLSKLGITGSSRRFLEKIFGKGNLDEMIKRDPEMHRGLLEVTEMFRNRDKEGLKSYMKNFLPHMDDTQIEEFIVGDAVDSVGQAKFGLGDMQGQLIRLGSGRDYKGKLEAIKKLEDAQKLDTLDVTEEMIRKPNAFGGIQTMLGE